VSVVELIPRVAVVQHTYSTVARVVAVVHTWLQSCSTIRYTTLNATTELRSMSATVEE